MRYATLAEAWEIGSEIASATLETLVLVEDADGYRLTPEPRDEDTVIEPIRARPEILGR